MTNNIKSDIDSFSKSLDTDADILLLSTLYVLLMVYISLMNFC